MNYREFCKLTQGCGAMTIEEILAKAKADGLIDLDAHTVSRAIEICREDEIRKLIRKMRGAASH